MRGCCLAYRQPNDMGKKNVNGLDSSMNQSTKFHRGGNLFKGSENKKKTGCFGIGWSSQDCGATERIWMLVEKAIFFIYIE